MIDAVLSYHMDGQKCGVAKFNHELARRLGVPCLPIGSKCAHPLVSIKASEMNGHWAAAVPEHPPWVLLLHDRPADVPKWSYGPIFYADELGCPSTLNGNPTRGKYRVLVFGMAHKLVLPHFERLKQQLDVEHPNYTVELSTAVHEGSPWDGALEESANAMRNIFGDKLRVLGFLADDALAKELQDVDAVALFYEPALRANNTTAWAAMAAGKTLYTNRDEHSPTVAPTWESVIQTLQESSVRA